jgi:hypothetical protein
MTRCTEHGLLNCKCKETLAAYLARQIGDGHGSQRDRSGRDHNNGDPDRVPDRLADVRRRETNQ